MTHIQSDTTNNNGRASATAPDPEVVAKAERRHFTAEYKRRILQEADACCQPGEVGAPVNVKQSTSAATLIELESVAPKAIGVQPTGLFNRWTYRL
jgi:hypothetical protein